MYTIPVSKHLPNGLLELSKKFCSKFTKANKTCPDWDLLWSNFIIVTEFCMMNNFPLWNGEFVIIIDVISQRDVTDSPKTFPLWNGEFVFSSMEFHR